jgi:hypothetical protein
MNAVDELEQVLIDQVQGLSPVTDEGASTQQLLDELLGLFEDDDSPLLPAYAHTLDSYADSAE